MIIVLVVFVVLIFIVFGIWAAFKCLSDKNPEDCQSLHVDSSTGRETSEPSDDRFFPEVHDPKPPNVLDLIEFPRLEAIEAFERFLRYHRQLREHSYLMIITGWGKLSPNNIPVIKPTIEEYLSTNEPFIKIDYRNENEGCILIYDY